LLHRTFCKNTRFVSPRICGSSAVPVSQVRGASAHPQSSYYAYEACAHQFFRDCLKFPTFYETRRLITVLSLSWARPIQSKPSLPISLRTLSISSFYAHIFQAVSFIQVSLSKPCTHFSSPHTCHVPCQSRPVRFDQPNIISWGAQLTTLPPVHWVLGLSHLSWCWPPIPSSAEVASGLEL
jgi:hypothetical protein